MTELPRSVSDPVRVLLVEDQDLFREGLRLLIDNHPKMRVVGEAKNRCEALATAASAHPQVILLDLDLGDDQGLDFLPELLANDEGMQILILTGVNNLEMHLHAVRLGAKGLVSKSEAGQTLVNAILKVHAGEVWLNGTMVTCLLNEMWDAHNSARHAPVVPSPDANGHQVSGAEPWPIDGESAAETNKIAALTKREREIIGLIGEGLSNQQIAERLFISSVTVRHHLTSIFSKLEVMDRFGLAIYAYRHGLAKIPR